MLEPADQAAFDALANAAVQWVAQPWEQAAGGGTVPNLYAIFTTESLFDVTLRLDFSPYVYASAETLESLAEKDELDVLVRRGEQDVQVRLPAPADPEGLLLAAARAMRETTRLSKKILN